MFSSCRGAQQRSDAIIKQWVTGRQPGHAETLRCLTEREPRYPAAPQISVQRQQNGSEEMANTMLEEYVRAHFVAHKWCWFHKKPLWQALWWGCISQLLKSSSVARAEMPAQVPRTFHQQGCSSVSCSDFCVLRAIEGSKKKEQMSGWEEAMKWSGSETIRSCQVRPSLSPQTSCLPVVPNRCKKLASDVNCNLWFTTPRGGSN